MPRCGRIKGDMGACDKLDVYGVKMEENMRKRIYIYKYKYICRNIFMCVYIYIYIYIYVCGCDVKVS